MSGHSKWSTIKHKKAARDHVKGNVFTKMANNITVAVKKGGGIGDPDMNFSLRLAIEKARAVNMPAENIKRAIEHGLGNGDGRQLSEMTIEGFGPGGYCVIVEAVTDNTNRTVGEVRLVMEKHGGTMGVPGSVMYQFDRVAAVEYEGILNDDLQLNLIDLGANDFDVFENGGVVYGIVESTKLLSDKLASSGLTVVDANLIYRPKVTVEANTEEVEEYLDIIRELDDVQEIYTNVV
ncbi:MAG: YebC/PmpR family DNA-binding transcriptional regulator [bacterium]